MGFIFRTTKNYWKVVKRVVTRCDLCFRKNILAAVLKMDCRRQERKKRQERRREERKKEGRKKWDLVISGMEGVPMTPEDAATY